MNVVWRHWLKTIISVGLVLTLLSACLFSSVGLSGSAPQWVQTLAREIQAACRDPGTQWMVTVCLLSYFIVFVVLRRRQRSIRYPLSAILSPNFWLSAFVALVLLRYAFDYTNAARSLQVVVLLTGIVVGKGIALWVGASRGFKLQGSSCKLGAGTAPSSILYPPSSSRGLIILQILTLLLAVAALWHPERGMEFFYRGQSRWTGPWDNPNLFGVLMGVGLILAVGLLVSRLQSSVSSLTSRGQSRGTKGEVGEIVGDEVTSHSPEALLTSCPTINYQLKTIHYAQCLLLLCAAAFCAYGLLKSYSRGAWLGTACGLFFLLWKWITCESREKRSQRKLATFNFQPATSQLWLSSSILLFSILVICFWQFRHTESPLARRLFSVGNPNDFSWRNRVTAWQGASRMMLDKPVFGFGWGKAEETYSKQYRAARLEEAAAIQMNDYLMLGISAGTPALLCLLAYLGLTMSRGPVGRGSPLPAAGGASVLASRLVSRLAPPPGDTSTSNASSLPVGFPGLSTIHHQLSTIAASGALVVAVGFWFDGGLFKLPTAVVFWVLIELARRADIPVCRCGRLSSRPVQALGAGEHGTGKPHAPAGWKTCPTLALRLAAGFFALAALGLTALHLVTPKLVVSERSLSIARKFLVPPQEQNDFEYLAAQPIWSGQSLKVLLEHAHLANYNRALVNWKLSDELYREFVLSPKLASSSGLPITLAPSDGERAGVRGDLVLSNQLSTIHHPPSTELNWRRPLWEFFYPRIRKESSLEAAAEIVARQLRERVTISAGADLSASIPDNWQRQSATAFGFERIYVAALRSVGIPAQLSVAGQAEFWNGSEWKSASPPLHNP